MIADFSSETAEFSQKRNTVFQALKEETCQPRMLCSANEPIKVRVTFFCRHRQGFFKWILKGRGTKIATVILEKQHTMGATGLPNPKTWLQSCGHQGCVALVKGRDPRIWATQIRPTDFWQKQSSCQQITLSTNGVAASGYLEAKPNQTKPLPEVSNLASMVWCKVDHGLKCGREKKKFFKKFKL